MIARAIASRARSATASSSRRCARIRAAEIAALRPAADETVVVVSSGGCTALSLLAAGAGRVVAVDLNRDAEPPGRAQGGGHADSVRATRSPSSARDRRPRARRRTPRCASRLSPSARRYWDARARRSRRGVLGAGVSERFIGAVVTALLLAVHPALARRSPARLPHAGRAARAVRARVGHAALARAVRAPLQPARASQHVSGAVLRARGEPELRARTSGVSPSTRSPSCRCRATTSSTRCSPAAYPVGEPDGVPPYLSDAGATAVAARGTVCSSSTVA